MTTYDELLEKSKKHAEDKGIKLNPNSKIVTAILNGLLRNEERFGELYCPCKMRTGDKEKDKAIICPCRDSMKEIERDGHCTCRLFWKKD